MKMNTLGTSHLKVSHICLGTMTFGEQNSEAEGHQQLDYALDQDINFIDTAELYAIPPRAETQGRTEQIIGTWLAKRKNRDKVILASKVCGPGRDWIPHIRNGGTQLDRTNIKTAIEQSLKRLQTDYLDLYQLHWPDRPTNYFGKLGYRHVENESSTPIEETLEVLGELVTEGKIRAIGLSNETPWGVMTFLKHAQMMDLPRAVSIQNPYSLLNRTFEIGLAEIAHREAVGLLAYSPLGFGVLSGKYLDKTASNQSRLNRWPDYNRYSNPQAVAATQAYVDIANRYNLSPSQMALAYVSSRPFLTSTIIGATTMAQLQSNIEGCNLQLEDEIIEAIDAVHVQHPNPSP